MTRGVWTKTEQWMTRGVWTRYSRKENIGEKSNHGKEGSDDKTGQDVFPKSLQEIGL